MYLSIITPASTFLRSRFYYCIKLIDLTQKKANQHYEYHRTDQDLDQTNDAKYLEKMKVFCLICSFLIMCIFCQDIEYYPSASVLKAAHDKLNKHLKTIERNTYSFVVKKDYGDELLRKFNIVEEPKDKIRKKRATDPVFHGHPKTREEQWNEHFLNDSKKFDQSPSFITLLHKITMKYLNDCTPIILYDGQVSERENHLFQSLFQDFPVSYVHGKINENNTLQNPKIVNSVGECVHYIVFLANIKTCEKVIGMQSTSKVVIVARTSQWAIQEFLASKTSRKFVNLLVIGQSFKENGDAFEAPHILYTHKLYIDGLGASKPVVLTSWAHGKFSREVDLFPPKMTQGYAGHRFVVAAANQPPFVFKRIQRDDDGGNPKVVWDGIEIRILKMLAVKNNFSIEIKEPTDLTFGPGGAVAKEVSEGRADIGVAGMYLTQERILEMDMSFSHSDDCAVFITLMSTALPRYRAILGPFHWHVWVALTFTYLIGIFPLAFSDKHTLRHLLNNSGEVENMFWYVFGTFTNCFTFVGANSWSKTTKITTRLLIGWYWIFTIIITSCYTGSIIAFVTLPIFPETVDTIDQLLSGFFRIGTLDRGGWERWFLNSSDEDTNKLLKKIELVPNVEAGIRNTTKAFFWPYSFLGSQAELEFIVKSNFSKTSSKRAMLHVSNECFVPFGVSMGFPNQSLYTAQLSSDISRMYQSGLISKIYDEVKWEMQRSASGTLLAASSEGTIKVISAEEKGLTLEDTQGMFLLLGAGFLMAAAALISEWMGGCTRKCRVHRKTKEKPPTAGSREQLISTPVSSIPSEIQIFADDDDSRIKLTDRSSTAASLQTLDGNIINLTEDNIVVHQTFDLDAFGSRRSSSVEVDREIREIFERDRRRRRIQSISNLDVCREEERRTVSKAAFGDRVGTG